MSEKESTRALSGARTSSVLIPQYGGVRGPTTWEETDGWMTQSGFNLVYYESYLDMSGFVHDSMTTFPEAALIQDPGRYTLTNDGICMQVVDMITTERMAPALISTWATSTNSMPGMTATNVDWSQIVWGQYRTLLPQATFQGNASQYLTAEASLFGSGEPSTASKLWVYRFVLVEGAIDTNAMTIPASRIILNTIHAKEEEKVFLMRQKRSYEIGSDF